MSNITGKLLGLLSGEPLRAIVYIAAVVIWAVSLASGSIKDISLDNALVQATAVAAAVTELSRRFVFSPPTVERIEDAAGANAVEAYIAAQAAAAAAGEPGADVPSEGAVEATPGDIE